MSDNGTKDSRIDLRISKENKSILEVAMTMAGHNSLSSFISSNMLSTAKDIILEHDKVLKSIEDKKIFVEAILKSEK